MLSLLPCYSALLALCIEHQGECRGFGMLFADIFMHRLLYSLSAFV